MWNLSMDAGRYGRGECWSFQFFVLLHPCALLLFVMINDVLICWAGLRESIQLVLLLKGHASPPHILISS
uniref:Chloride intracellular channel isoform n=1 Tax=Cherax quadricarinatus TaxID=27406 RepID=G0ZJ08_CHEQU|nr:chloride intracellular channel isoform [Cherax quadricarinatus]